MSEVLSDYFTTIGPNLASKILPSSNDPESYLQPSNTALSFTASNVSTVRKLLRSA